MNKLKYGLILLLCFCTACEVEGGKRSTISSNSVIVNTSTNSVNSSFTSFSTSSSTIISTSTGLPFTSLEFINAVNSIIVDENAGESISNAFALFDALSEWDYPEVLEAYDKLCKYEDEYNILINIRQKITLFVEKVLAFPEQITLEDEYLIVRAEDSYSKLDEELKAYPEVIEAYNTLIAVREEYNVLKEEAMLKKDQADAANFLLLVEAIPEISSLTYSHYFQITRAIEGYEELSDRAKTFEGITEAYAKLENAKQTINIQDGANLFDINIIHKATNWECMLDIQGIDEEHKVTGQNKVFNLMVYENGTPVAESAILKWGDAPVATSYTRSNGIHSFSFTIKKAYSLDNNYNLEFIIKTNKEEAYAISIKYMVDKRFTCYGYTSEQFFKNQLERRAESLFPEDYTQENWEAVQALLTEGKEVLLTAINDEHSKMIVNQYYHAMTGIERIFTTLSGAKVIEVSSKEEQIGNMLDGKTGTSWQATSTINGYIVIDLGAEYSMVGMSIMWQNSNAKDYTIKFSNSNSDWDSIDPVYSFDNGLVGDRTDEVRFPATSGRFIRIDMGKSTTNYGFRIFEIYLYQARA